MSNILSLKKTGDAVNVPINDAKAIIDTVAREINKENRSYYSKGRAKKQEYRNNKLSRNDEPKNNTYKRYTAFKTDKRSNEGKKRKT